MGRYRVSALRGFRRRSGSLRVQLSTLCFVLFAVTLLRLEYFKSSDLSSHSTAPDVLQEKSPYLDRSAIFTPYHLTPGGGEKVILTFVAQLQRLTGRPVDILVSEDNVCKAKSCAQQVAHAVDVVGIDWDEVNIEILGEQSGYLIWIHTTNSLYPFVPSRGLVGVLHCQFPFDGQQPNSIQGFQHLGSYRIVYLYSEYALKWYSVFLEKELTKYEKETGVVHQLPHLTQFPPPVHLLRVAEPRSDESASRQGSLKIVLLGRFFEGRQGKRHLLAIKAFKKLRARKKKARLSLHLVGHVATGHEKYVASVRKAAARVPNVHVITNADAQQKVKILEGSDVIWALTGLGAEESKDPADAEHFGLALLEGMSAGLIPIVAKKGGYTQILRGMPEILQISSIEELVKATLHVVSMSEKDRSKLSSRSHTLAQGFDTFDQNFQSMFTVLGIPLHQTTLGLWKSIFQNLNNAEYDNFKMKMESENCESPTNSIVYMDTRVDYMIKFNLAHLQSKLGKGWSIHVWHSAMNEIDVKLSLRNVECVKFHSIEGLLSSGADTFDPRLGNGSYNAVWKSLAFWQTFESSVKHVLNFQSDVIFAQSSFDDSFLDFEYVGAPWCLENTVFKMKAERPPEDYKYLHDSRTLPRAYRVGNGGVALRNKYTMQELIIKYGHSSNPSENEDVFFVQSLHDDRRKITDEALASRFAIECLCLDLELHKDIINLFKGSSAHFLHIGHRPFAIHKPIILYMHLVQHLPLHSQEVFLPLFTSFLFGR